MSKGKKKFITFDTNFDRYLLELEKSSIDTKNASILPRNLII